MIAQLSILSSTADPTAFHDFLQLLNERGQLLRVYTQNIDALEKKAGLSFGVPHWKPKRNASSPAKKLAASPIQPITSIEPLLDEQEATPRVIPLHGTLNYLSCTHCSHSTPLSSHLDVLAQGISVSCPECDSLDSIRRLVGQRARGVGKMRPSVVLYGEQHEDGESVGECVRRDLTGLGDVQPLGIIDGSADGGANTPARRAGPRARASARPDLLIVAGTSLKVPGTRRIVKEFSKSVIHATSSSSPTKSKKSSSPTGEEDETPATPRTIYLNLEFPQPVREWAGVFDVWVQGDIQAFVPGLHAALAQADEEKEKKSGTKRKAGNITPVKPKSGTPAKKRQKTIHAPSTPDSSPPGNGARVSRARPPNTPRKAVPPRQDPVTEKSHNDMLDTPSKPPFIQLPQSAIHIDDSAPASSRTRARVQRQYA